jgi:hypothetical protein
MSRTPARGQQLPPQEVELLNSLQGEQRIERVAALYNAGWSLQTIGDSLQPTHPRSTIRTWVQRAKGLNTIDAPIPAPRVKTTENNTSASKPKSQGLSQDAREVIHQLAPLARTYRSRMSSTSSAAVANARLTDLCKKLYANGTSIRELAEAAGVTYRAMYKRIKL